MGSQEPLAADEAATGKLTTMMLAMADVRAVLVNLAARLHQLRGLAARGENGPAAIAVAEETLRVFAPLANCLGIWSLKAEMEDLCFQVRADFLAQSIPRGVSSLLVPCCRRPLNASRPTHTLSILL